MEKVLVLFCLYRFMGFPKFYTPASGCRQKCRNVGAQKMEKKKRKYGKGKKEIFTIWTCHFFKCRLAEMESLFLHFYMYMGTTPNFGRLFLNLRRIVEVKKVGNLFLGGATLVNKFFWKSIGFSHPYPLSLYRCRNVEMQKWKVDFYISTFLHPYGDNSKFWQTLSQSTQNCRSKKSWQPFSGRCHISK